MCREHPLSGQNSIENSEVCVAVVFSSILFVKFHEDIKQTMLLKSEPELTSNVSIEDHASTHIRRF